MPSDTLFTTTENESNNQAISQYLSRKHIQSKNSSRNSDVSSPVLSGIQGCLLGQLAGDELGNYVERDIPEKVARQFPERIREHVNNKCWETITFQRTDDNEMALVLAYSLLEWNDYLPHKVRAAYYSWLGTGPSDIDNGTYISLTQKPNRRIETNGALKRAAALGLFGCKRGLKVVAGWARKDAEMTHPNPVTIQVNVLFAMAIAHAINTRPTPQNLYNEIIEWTDELEVHETIQQAVSDADSVRPTNYFKRPCWAVTAFHNALWQLLHANTIEDGIIDTVIHGGDTGANAAICGALLGAVHGSHTLSRQWLNRLSGYSNVANIYHMESSKLSANQGENIMKLAEKLVACL